MIQRFKFLLLAAVALCATACGGDDTGGSGDKTPTLSITLQSITPSATRVSLKLASSGLERFGYLIEPKSATVPTAEDILADGVVSKVASTGNISFSVDKLMPGTTYRFSFVGIAADGSMTEVGSEEFATDPIEGFAMISTSKTGFSAYVGKPSSVAAGNVVKWAVTDIVRHALGGSDPLVALNRNEQEAKNVIDGNAQIDVTQCDGGAIIPGQPMWVFVGEFAQGSHPEWGDGYYRPMFGAAGATGYLHQQKVTTTTPSTSSVSASISTAVRADGSGTITISPDAGVNTLYYVVLDDEQYASLTTILENKNAYKQWFVASATARELYGARTSKGVTIIDCSKLSLVPEATYHLLVTVWGDAKGNAQSFTETTFSTPPVAPLAAGNNVVAHRGGSKEAGTASTPDNSIASLRYAQRLGCYASEADIYWTKDDRVIVAHADGNIKINGLHPWEHTLSELQQSGCLSNGEKLPSLEEYLAAVMVKGSCTKLWLDIKNCYVSSSQQNHDYVVKATVRACEIIKAMGAEKWVEFICTGYEQPLEPSKAAADAIGVPFAWMANKYAATYESKGVKWANLSVEYIKDGINDTSKAIHTVESFTDRGIEFSVYTIDDVTTMDYYVARDDVKAITTNYPSRLLARMKR